MTDRKQLLEDLRTAEEGSRDLSDKVLIALGWRKDAMHTPVTAPIVYWIDPQDHQHGAYDPLPDPSRNLQDVVDLVPEGLDWGRDKTGAMFVFEKSWVMGETQGRCWAVDTDRRPPALALSIALVRAQTKREGA